MHCITCPQTRYWRYVTFFIVWLYVVEVYLQRTVTSLAMIDMAQTPNTSTSKKIYSSCYTVKKQSGGKYKDVKTKKFIWTQSQQGWAISSYLVGYLVLHIPLMLLIYEVGFKIVLLIGLATSSTLTILTPILVTKFGFWAIAIIRVCNGGSVAATYPALQQCVGAFSPPAERSRSMGFLISSNVIGLILNSILGGLLSEYYGPGYWKILHYLTGGAGFLVTTLWFFLVFDTPAKHKYMSKEERELIETTTGQSKKRPLRVKDIPLIVIFKSPCIYVLMICHFGKMTVFFCVTFWLPKFYRDGRGFSPLESSLYPMVPFITDFALHFVIPPAVDYAIAHTKYSVSVIRRASNFIGGVFSPFFIMCVYFVKCGHFPADLILISLSLSSTCFLQVGYMVSVIEICPSLSGFTMGVINILGSLSGVISIQINAYFTGQGDFFVGQKKAFLVIGAITFVCEMVYVIFGTSENQHWDKAMDLSPQPAKFVKEDEIKEEKEPVKEVTEEKGKDDSSSEEEEESHDDASTHEKGLKDSVKDESQYEKV